MRIHPRTFIVAEASVEFRRAFAAIEEKYDLTIGEMLLIFGDYMTSWAKYAIREERHGNCQTPGDRAVSESSEGEAKASDLGDNEG